MTLLGNIRNIVSIKTNPRKNTLWKAMIFWHAQNCINHFSSARAKITCSIDKFYLAHLINQAIKFAFKERQTSSFISLFLKSSNTVILWMFIQYLNHLAHNFRTLLQISINQCYKITLCMLHSCQDCCFLSKITWKLNDCDRCFFSFLIKQLF